MKCHHGLWQSKPEDATRAGGLGTDKLAGQGDCGEGAWLCIEKWCESVEKAGTVRIQSRFEFRSYHCAAV